MSRRKKRPTITSGPPPNATLNQPYTFTFRATGNPPPTFGATMPLPTGLALNSATGVLSGTPSAAGTFTFSVTATNSAGTATAGPFTVVVAPATSVPVFTAKTPPLTATVGVPYTYTFAASGAPAPTFTAT